MTDPRRTPADPVDHLMLVWTHVLLAYPATWPALTVEDQVSALGSLLFNLTVRALQRADDPQLRAQLRRFGHTLATLADTPPAQLEVVAQYLADEPRPGLRPQ